MAGKVKNVVVHDEKCGNCFYNQEGTCNKNSNKCVYNQPINAEDEVE